MLLPFALQGREMLSLPVASLAVLGQASPDSLHRDTFSSRQARILGCAGHRKEHTWLAVRTHLPQASMQTQKITRSPHAIACSSTQCAGLSPKGSFEHLRSAQLLGPNAIFAAFILDVTAICVRVCTLLCRVANVHERTRFSAPEIEAGLPAVSDRSLHR